MSWDISIGDFPPEIASVQDFPSDFSMKPLGTHAEIIEKICVLYPQANFSDPAWGLINGEGYSIEVNMGKKEPLTGFMLHVRGGEQAMFAVADLLDHLHLRGIDCQTSEFFVLREGLDSFQKWRVYRDRVVRDKTP